VKNKILFIVPEYDIKTPRTIRIENIVGSFKRGDYLIAKFNFNNSKDDQFVNIKYNWLARIYYRYRIRGIFRRIDGSFLDDLSPFIGIITKSLFNIIEQENISTIVIVSAPFSLFKLSGALRKKFPDVSIIYDIGDPFYYNSSKRMMNSEEYKIQFEKEMLTSTDGIIVTNYQTKAMYNKFYHLPNDKIKVIPQGVNLELLRTVNRKKCEDNSKQIKIIYSGIFYPGLRDPDNFFKAIEKVKNYRADIYGSNLNIEYQFVHFHNRIKQDKLFKIMACSDVILFIDNHKGIQTPGKIYEVLSFKKNILFIYSNKESATLKFVRELNSDNIIIVENDEEKIINILRSNILFSNNNINYEVKEFSWENRSKLYLDFIKNIGG